jgi:hypothetical protein
MRCGRRTGYGEVADDARRRLPPAVTALAFVRVCSGQLGATRRAVIDKGEVDVAIEAASVADRFNGERLAVAVALDVGGARQREDLGSAGVVAPAVEEIGVGEAVALEFGLKLLGQQKGRQSVRPFGSYIGYVL